MSARKRGSSVGGSASPGSAGAAKPKRDAPASKPDAGGTHARAGGPGTLAGTLYVVATPIGNAADVTLRALRVLTEADAVACEDTRVTGRLLAIHGISASLLPYHDHNADRVRPALIRRLKDGDSVALVSDAGTPLVSDPGYKLVRACIADGIPVTAVPGASAVLAALVLSGLPTDRFLFEGFLPAKQAARRAALGAIAAVPATLVFMESARRLPAALADMAAVLGPRDAAVVREITKLHEEAVRGPLPDLAGRYAGTGPPRGEVMVVVAPPGAAAAATEADAERLLTDALGRLSLRDAVREVTDATGLPRRTVYDLALALSRGGR